MMKTLLALATLLVSCAAVSAESSVWKLTRGKSVLYLGGTVHVLRAADLPLPDEFDQAYAASQKLYFESDIARMQTPEVQQIILSKGMYTDGKSLDKELSAEAWALAKEYCDQSGIPVPQAKMMKPWLFTLMVTALELQKLGVSSEGVDVLLHRKAAKDGKAIGMLESFEEHIDYLVNMGRGKESEMIENSMNDLRELPSVVDGLLSAWKAGDIAKLEEFLVKELRETYPSLYKELLVDRNAAWLPKIEVLAKSPEVEFVLVGVGHLAGDKGLLASLKSRGYAIEQVK